MIVDFERGSRTGGAGSGNVPGAVLVVDDEPDIREVLRMCLEGEGYSVAVAANGREALDRIASMRPSAILLDLNMPIMTGWELLHELRTRGIEVPVLFMSAGRAVETEARRHGVDGWIAKPFDLDDLVDIVQRTLSTGNNSSKN